MTAEEVKNTIRCGETSTVQFKQLFRTAEDVANELIEFSNSNGGRILIGINDKTDANIEFVNEASGDQFKVILHRIGQKIKTGMAASTVQIYLDKLREANIIRRVVPDKGGRREVIDRSQI